MAELWAPFYSAWEVLTLRATVAVFVMLADSGTVAQTTCLALLIVRTKGKRTARPTLLTPLVVLADNRGIALPTCLALLVVLAES